MKTLYTQYKTDQERYEFMVVDDVANTAVAYALPNPVEDYQGLVNFINKNMV